MHLNNLDRKDNCYKDPKGNPLRQQLILCGYFASLIFQPGRRSEHTQRHHQESTGIFSTSKEITNKRRIISYILKVASARTTKPWPWNSWKHERENFGDRQLRNSRERGVKKLELCCWAHELQAMMQRRKYFGLYNKRSALRSILKAGLQIHHSQKSFTTDIRSWCNGMDKGLELGIRIVPFKSHQWP